MRLQCNIASVSDLKIGDRQKMLSLMQRHYDNVCPQVFQADLNQKRWVIQLLEPQSGELCGFSTQTLSDVQVDGRPVQALFSGYTIIDRAKWGDQALAYAWGELVMQLIDQGSVATQSAVSARDCGNKFSLADEARHDQPTDHEAAGGGLLQGAANSASARLDRRSDPRQCSHTELWWFLIAAGYKTYRFLPVYFKEFYPRHDLATPAPVQAVIDALAGHLYPEHYDANTGVIQAQSHQYRLRAGVADITAQRLRDPHIAFFAQKNPGHAAGDELCCVARLTRSNFTRAAERIYPIYSATKCDNPR